jgi:hypothetical protein
MIHMQFKSDFCSIQANQLQAGFHSDLTIEVDISRDNTSNMHAVSSLSRKIWAVAACFAIQHKTYGNVIITAFKSD